MALQQNHKITSLIISTILKQLILQFIVIAKRKVEMQRMLCSSLTALWIDISGCAHVHSALYAHSKAFNNTSGPAK